MACRSSLQSCHVLSLLPPTVARSLLETYGFLLPGNPHDEAPLPLALLEAVCSNDTQGTSGGRAGGGGRHKQAQAASSMASQLARLAIGSSREELGGDGVASAGGGRVRLPDWLTQEGCFIHANGQPSWKLLQALRLVARLAASALHKPHQINQVPSFDQASLKYGVANRHGCECTPQHGHECAAHDRLNTQQPHRAKTSL